MMLWHHSPPPVSSQEAVRDSIYQQAHYLANHLELDPGGNHLLENLRALAIAAVFLETKMLNAWLNTIEPLFRRELPIQCLDSGEHFERAPAYHSIVLELLREVRDVWQQLRPATSEWVGSYVESMQSFLASICHPDGEIPLFSDSAFGPAPCAKRCCRALIEKSIEVRR